MVYLFLAGEAASKDAAFKAIKREFLAKDTEQFNFDLLHSRGLSLRELQEKLLSLPVQSSLPEANTHPKRIVIIKNIQDLKEDVKEYVLGYVRQPFGHVVLVLDAGVAEKEDVFLKGIAQYAKVSRFKLDKPVDTFVLSDFIRQGNAQRALLTLSQLEASGEKPERLLGGLRYSWEKYTISPLALKKGLRFMLNCDLEIKTGKLRPFFALEKLVVSLCGLSNLFG